MSLLSRMTATLLLATSAGGAQATLGLFEHGNGIQSMGMGGVSYSIAGETTALGANPAHALSLGHRYDVGVDTFWALATARYVDNDLGDDLFRTDAKRYYYIPQGGYTRPLAERWAIGVSLLSAGLGPDYPRSPYERFGGASRVNFSLGSSSLSTALAYRIRPRHVLAASLNTGYQVLAINGLEFLAAPQLSLVPDRVTNQGKDGAFTLGFSLGWIGEITPWLSAGIGYRSKNWSQRHEEYEGLIAGSGRLELPAIYGGGFTLRPASAWTVSIEAQRYTYRDERALRNGIGSLLEGVPLGSSNGPGFGLDDQNAYKLGLSWKPSPKLTLRAGYVHATEMVNAEETLFGFLGCLVITDQYTIGGSYAFGDWELSGYAIDAPEQSIKGRNSIPEAFGGGEAWVTDQVVGIGISVGRRF